MIKAGARVLAAYVNDVFGVEAESLASEAFEAMALVAANQSAEAGL